MRYPWNKTAAAFAGSLGAVLMKQMEDAATLRLQAWVGLVSFLPLVLATSLLEHRQCTSAYAIGGPFVGAVLFAALIECGSGAYQLLPADRPLRRQPAGAAHADDAALDRHAGRGGYGRSTGWWIGRRIAARHRGRARDRPAHASAKRPKRRPRSGGRSPRDQILTACRRRREQPPDQTSTHSLSTMQRSPHRRPSGNALPSASIRTAARLP